VIAEVDRIREFHGLAGAQWMDAYTGPDNDVLNAVWKGRRTIQRLAIGTGARGRLAVASLSMLQRIKRFFEGRSARRGGPSAPSPAVADSDKSRAHAHAVR
jgi:hypothetical protein